MKRLPLVLASTAVTLAAVAFVGWRTSEWGGLGGAETQAHGASSPPSPPLAPAQAHPPAPALATSPTATVVYREGEAEHPALREKRMLLAMAEREAARPTATSTSTATATATAGPDPDTEHPSVREKRLLESLAQREREGASPAPPGLQAKERAEAWASYAEDAPPPGPAPLPARASPPPARRPPARPAPAQSPAVEVPARLDAWGE